LSAESPVARFYIIEAGTRLLEGVATRQDAITIAIERLHPDVISHRLLLIRRKNTREIPAVDLTF
jgi:hypothetical protein